MPVVQEAAHMGIVRSVDNQESTVNQNIEKARRTMYWLMGAGLHGDNVLDPDSSIHILQTSALPLLVYGLRVLLPRKTLLVKLERTYKKFLKQILSLPSSTADPTIYILSGTIPNEGYSQKDPYPDWEYQPSSRGFCGEKVSTTAIICQGREFT